MYAIRSYYEILAFFEFLGDCFQRADFFSHGRIEVTVFYGQACLTCKNFQGVDIFSGNRRPGNKVVDYHDAQSPARRIEWDDGKRALPEDVN